uniref:Uncharacterized protein n=1 Tax=Caenorhabditis tropicalis TaxID=1561998 RepID=A0A1I7TVX8_9PELO
MSSNREFSHVTISTTPFKVRMDEKAKKTEGDIEKDRNIACKCAERFNYNTNLLKKVSLSDRFELAALGYEMKGKPIPRIEDDGGIEGTDFIYRKEKRQDYTTSPLPAGMSPANPLPAGRGFLSPAIHATNNVFPYSPNSRDSPRKSLPVSSPCQPTRSIFDDIPVNIA